LRIAAWVVLTSAAARPTAEPLRSMMVACTLAAFLVMPLALTSLAVALLCRTLVLGAVDDSLQRTSELI
jgi:hypothetical protein